MIAKLKIFILACILIISTLFTGFGICPGSENAGAEELRGTGPGTSPESNDDILWDRVRVVGEPVEGQNQNNLDSYNARVAAWNEMIYVVWADESNYQNSGFDADIFFRYYNGTNWSGVEILSEPTFGSDVNKNFSGYPDIAVYNGNIYVVWEDQNNTDGSGGDSDIFYRSYISGVGWGPIQVISEPHMVGNYNTGNSYMPAVAVDNGNPYVVWQDNNNTNGAGTDNDIHYRQFFFGGGWGPILVISEPDFGYNNAGGGGSQEPDIAVENGNIYTVWTDQNATNSSGTDPDIHYRPYTAGTGWGPIQVISEPVADADTNKNYSDYASIDVEDGNVYVVWEDKNDTNGAGGNSDIFFITNMAGIGWSEVQVISEPEVGKDNTDGDGSTPGLAVDYGQVYVVWESVNATDGSDTDSDIFYRFSPTGTDWEEIQVISEPALTGDINVGESYEPAIAVEFGKSHVVWHDDNVTYGSDTDQDIFYRATLVAPTLTNMSVSPMYGNTSTMFNFTVTYADAENNAPMSVKVNIDGVNHTMLETDAADTSYRNGKVYYFASKLNIADPHTYRFWANDGLFVKGSAAMAGPVVNNTPPQIITADVTTAYEDVLYSVQYNYTDIDEANVGQALSWEFDTNATWLILNPVTGLLSGTPVENETGEYFVNVTINDTFAIDSHYFIVEVFAVNDKPVIHNTTIANSTYQDEFYEVRFNATDEDNNASALNWSLTTNATWLTYNLTEGVLNGTPANADVGTYWINISVTDGENVVWKNFTVEVINVNDPPVITTLDVTTATVGLNYTVQYKAYDIDLPPQNLTWTFGTSAGQWLGFNTSTQLLNGTPGSNDTGEFWVRITVYDTDNASDSHNFTLTVKPAPIPNQKPKIIGEDITEAEVGAIYYSVYKAMDDRTPATKLVWAFATNATTWLSFDNTSGELTGTPGENDTGVFWVTLIVADDEGGIALREFNITVTKPYIPPPPPNHAPVLTDGQVSPASGDTKTTFTFTVHYSDEDGDAPSEIKVIIDGVEYDMTLKSGVASNGIYEYRTKLGEGTHTYYFKASDGTVPAVAVDGTPLSDADAKTTPAVKKAEEQESSMIFFIIIILIVVVIVLFVVLAMRRKPREKPAEEAVEEEAEEEEEEGEEKKPKLFRQEFEETIYFGEDEEAGEEKGEEEEEEIPYEEGEEYIIEEDEEAARKVFEEGEAEEEAPEEEEAAEAEIVEAEVAEEAEEPPDEPEEAPEVEEAEEPSEEEMPETEEEEEEVLDDEEILDEDELKEFEDLTKE